MVTETQRRQIKASVGVVWVYFVAQSEGDFGAASSALSFFQRTWPSTRAALLAFFGSSAESVLPTGLPVTGGWTADTRDAVSLTLQGILGGEIWTDAEYNALPTTAGGIASWFNNRFDNLMQSSLADAELDLLWDFESLLDESTSLLQANLQAMTTQVLSGIRVGEPDVVAAGNDPARSVIDATGSAGAVADATNAATDDAGAAITAGGAELTEPEPVFTITGRTKAAPTWQYAVIGIGALAFGGLAYYLWRYRQRMGRAA